MEFNYKALHNDCISRNITAQVLVKATINAADRGGISKLLTVNADARAIGVETLSGEAVINGKVNYKILYADGEGKISGLDYFKDFEERISAETLSANIKAEPKLSIVDIDTEINADVATVTAVVEIELCTITAVEIKAVSGAAETECSLCNLQTQRVGYAKETAFEVVEEVPSGTDIEKILLFECNVIAMRNTSGADGIRAEGDIVCDMVYTAGGGRIFTKSITIAFNEVVLADNADNSEVYTEAFIKTSRLVLSGDESNNIIRIELIVGLSSKIFTCEAVEVADDIFSTAYEINCEKTDLQCMSYQGSVGYTGHIGTVAMLESNTPPVSMILATPPARNNLANLIARDGSIVAEGIAVVNVIYLAQDETLNSVQIELPYSFDISAPIVREDMIISGMAITTNVQVSVKNNGLEVNADVKLRMNVYSEMCVSVITGAAQGGVKQENAAGISIYFAEDGDSVWSIAKSLNVCPSVLIARNPAIADGIRPGMQILVFREKQLEDAAL